MVVQARASRYDRRKPPPPDLPSLLFDQRIVYLGMPVGWGVPVQGFQGGRQGLTSAIIVPGEALHCAQPVGPIGHRSLLQARAMPQLLALPTHLPTFSSGLCICIGTMLAAGASGDGAHRGRAAVPGEAGRNPAD